MFFVLLFRWFECICICSIWFHDESPVNGVVFRCRPREESEISWTYSRDLAGGMLHAIRRISASRVIMGTNPGCIPEYWRMLNKWTWKWRGPTYPQQENHTKLSNHIWIPRKSCLRVGCRERHAHVTHLASSPATKPDKGIAFADAIYSYRNEWNDMGTGRLQWGRDSDTALTQGPTLNPSLHCVALV